MSSLICTFKKPNAGNAYVHHYSHTPTQTGLEGAVEYKQGQLNIIIL